MVDDADPELAGDVGRGEHGLDPRQRERGRAVDAHDVGPGVVGQSQGGVEQSGHAQVVDEGAGADGQAAGLVLDPAAADARGQHGRRDLVGGERLDRVEDLHVAGAAAEVRAEVTGRVVARQLRTLLLEQRVHPHDDARRAEAALERAGRRERGRVLVAGERVEAFERRHRATGGLLEAHLARDHGLAVEEHGAAPALARRRATVLRRRDVELLAQRGEEVRVRRRDLGRRPVELERDRPVGFAHGVSSGGAGSGGSSTPRWLVIRV